MTALELSSLAEEYWRTGVVSTPILSRDEAAEHQSHLESGESKLGALHYIDKVHTVMRSPYEVATDPRVLDIVESLIGPDILLYNVTYIIKEPGADTYVAWHQDLTYWGLSDDDAQVSMWLALSPATVESGCMAMIPGSHRDGPHPHIEDSSDSNLLLLGQHIADIDDSMARHYPLDPGEASFHHGWTVHTSAPNTSDDRRIGLNVQYLAPHCNQASSDATAMLVRGTDSFGYFGTDRAPVEDFEPAALASWRELNAAMKANFTVK